MSENCINFCPPCTLEFSLILYASLLSYHLHIDCEASTERTHLAKWEWRADQKHSINSITKFKYSAMLQDSTKRDVQCAEMRRCGGAEKRKCGEAEVRRRGGVEVQADIEWCRYTSMHRLSIYIEARLPLRRSCMLWLVYSQNWEMKTNHIVYITNTNQ